MLPEAAVITYKPEETPKLKFRLRFFFRSATVCNSLINTNARRFHSGFHSRPQSPRSFWPVPGIESSGFVQSGKSGKSDWLIIRN